MKRYQFPNMVPPTNSLPVGSAEWLRNKSLAVRSAAEATDRNGGRHLVIALQELLAHKPWLHVPLDAPAGNARDWLEGVTGMPYRAVVLLTLGLQEDALAQDLVNLCGPVEVRLGGAQ